MVVVFMLFPILGKLSLNHLFEFADAEAFSYFSEANTHYKNGVAALKNGDCELAIASFKKAIMTEPTDQSIKVGMFTEEYSPNKMLKEAEKTCAVASSSPKTDAQKDTPQSAPSPPPLTIALKGPVENNLTFANNIESVEISGSIKGGKGKVKLLIDGQEIPIDENKIFSATVPLLGGENKFNILAVDEGGKTFTKKLVLVKAQEQVAQKPLPTQSPSPSPSPTPHIIVKNTTPPLISDIKVNNNNYNAQGNVVSGQKAVVKASVSGKSAIALVYINGAEASMEKEGEFYSTVLLKQGQSEIEITAVDLDRNKTIKTVKIIKEDKLPFELKGRYFALIIGINKYKNIPGLTTAVGDAKKVAEVLKDKYGFEVKTMLDENATKDNIIDEINMYREKLSADDKFLVYYAGHGYFEKGNQKGYWLPVDAVDSRTTKWILVDEITSELNLIRAKQILIVADSCYSGTFNRGVEIRLTSNNSKGANINYQDDRVEYVKKMLFKASRTLMASGGNEPVSDDGGSGHSIFASAFLDGLLNIEDNFFTAEEFFVKQRVKERVLGKGNQTPEYNAIRNSGDDGGDFVFVKKK
ncbi:MAG: caspase family protein [Nitrospirae bacterium]|nr:caspase family protein [Nitrospirota bacterium]